MSRPPRLALALLCAAALSAAAQGDFWISVGSFKSFDAAQRLQATAALALAEPVQTVPAEVAGRNVFRVVGGPYESHATAAEHAHHAQANGYLDAWVWRASGVATAVPTSAALEVLPDITEAVDEGLASTASDDFTLDPDEMLDTDLDAVPTEDAALDLDFDNLANFDDFADLPSLAALDELDDFDDLDDLENLPPATPPARRSSFIETTEEPAWEAPPGFTLHRLPGPGDGTARRSFPEDSAGRDGSGRVMCKLVGWLPFVKSCDER